MKTAIKLVLIYFVMQILAALLVMPFKYHTATTFASLFYIFFAFFCALYHSPCHFR